MIVDELVALLRQAFAGFADARTGKNTTYRVSDAAAAAFSVFFTQSASFLAWQRTLSQRRGSDNARTLFGVEKLPSDNQIRNLLDPVCEEALGPVFGQALELLRASGQLENWRWQAGGFLIALDGSEYFRSTKICCPGCLRRTSGEGVTSYVHALISPALVSPQRDAVLVLEPEFIANADGQAKQDCEQAAARRWLERAPAHWKGSTLLGDDLYCHQPFCALALEYGLHFVFVCKPASHPALYEELAGLARLGAVQTLQVTRWNGRAREQDTYRFASALPLRGSVDALAVNFVELTTTAADGAVLYRNAFATDHPLEESSVAELVRAGRARWKIENGNFNTLKTKGYHLEHNFGHGQQHLAALLVALNLLAFLVHTLTELLDTRWQAIRAALPTRQTFHDDLRALTRYLVFTDWDALLAFMMQGLEIDLLSG